MLDHERFLLRTLDELEDAIESRDEHVLLRSSLPLRQLLLDPGPLFALSNRTHRLKIEWQVSEYRPPQSLGVPRADIHFQLDGLDPAVALPGRAVRSLGLSQFLSAVVGNIGPVDVSVADVVRVAAHKLGGVHYDPTSADEHWKSLIAENLNVGGDPHILRMLRPIGRVTIKALQPLREAIEGEPPPAVSAGMGAGATVMLRIGRVALRLRRWLARRGIEGQVRSLRLPLYMAFEKRYGDSRRTDWHGAFYLSGPPGSGGDDKRAACLALFTSERKLAAFREAHPKWSKRCRYARPVPDWPSLVSALEWATGCGFIGVTIDPPTRLGGRFCAMSLDEMLATVRRIASPS